MEDTMKTPLLCILTAAMALGSSPVLAESGYDGGFFVAGESGGGDFALKINGRVQTRFTFVMPDDDLGEDNEYAFSVARARIGLKGHLWSKALTFKIETDFGKGKASLKDFWFNYVLVDSFHLKAGRYKIPFSRQQLTSSGKQQFVDRAITDEAFLAGRDIGFMFHNGLAKTKGQLEWALGIFNGTSVVKDETPDRARPELVGRIGVQSEGFGNKAYSEGDRECTAGKPGTCGVRWAIAASAIYDFGGGVNGAGEEVDSQLEAQLDFVVKVSGFALDGGVYLDDNVGDGSGIETLGLHAQASYAFSDASLQPALRYARVWSPDEGGLVKQEVVLGFSAYLLGGHAVKWQTDVALLIDELANISTTNVMARSQVQVAF
ncbi:MAG: phosphate-selective porin OprO/OprP [Myxococcota bacterium]|jgi:phosphate-selective porin OprO/OprP